MPILLALVEAMVDPVYGVEHSGHTPGAETLIVLNGPILKDLNFNYTQGVLRDGFKQKTSVAHFLLLALHNMPGFLLHRYATGRFGEPFLVVSADNQGPPPQTR